MDHINGAVLLPIVLVILIGVGRFAAWRDRKDRESLSRYIADGCPAGEEPENVRHLRRW